ncbi:MAG: DALR anticodon-binding domain-containing protein, partial [Bacillota bacterium]|nr:DALR anticodon-binding domain-containing protein [Bacillota bacterium]
LLELPQGEAILALHRRAHQLLKGASLVEGEGSLEELLARLPHLSDEASALLREELSREGKKALLAWEMGDLETYAGLLQDLKPRVDAFLDGVRVLDEDEGKRRARLLALKAVTDLTELLGNLEVLTSGEPVR